jgi:hypothetical protein
VRDDGAVRRATPSVFFVGLTLLSVGLVMLARAPHAVLRVSSLDTTLQPSWLNTSPVTAWRSLSHADRVPDVETGFVALLGLCGVVGLAGAGLTRRKHAAALGGVLIGTACLAGTAAVAGSFWELRLLDPLGSCVSWGFLEETTFVARAMIALALGAAAIVAAAWGMLTRTRGLPLPVAALTVALGMIGFAAQQALASTTRWNEDLRPSAIVDATPVWWPFAALLAAGVVVSLTRPLLSSHLVSWLFMLVGLLASVAGVAVMHDAKLAGDQRMVSFDIESYETVPLTTCRPVRGMLPVSIEPRGVFVGMSRTTGGVDSLVLHLEHEREKYMDLANAAGTQPDFPGEVALLVAADSPLRTIQSVLTACRAAGYRHVEVVSWRRTPGETWTRATVHAHECAASFDIGDDGVPVGSFTTWAQLVRAAEDTTLVVR